MSTVHYTMGQFTESCSHFTTLCLLFTWSTLLLYVVPSLCTLFLQSLAGGIFWLYLECVAYDWHCCVLSLSLSHTHTHTHTHTRTHMYFLAQRLKAASYVVCTLILTPSTAHPHTIYCTPSHHLLHTLTPSTAHPHTIYCKPSHHLLHTLTPFTAHTHTIYCTPSHHLLHTLTPSTAHPHTIYCTPSHHLLHTLTPSTANPHTIYYTPSHHLLHTLTPSTAHPHTIYCTPSHHLLHTLTPSHSPPLQKEVLEESRQMIPDCNKRLEKAQAQLQDLVVGSSMQAPHMYRTHWDCMVQQIISLCLTVCVESVSTCLCLFTLKGGRNGCCNLLTRKGSASLSASVICLSTAHLCTVGAVSVLFARCTPRLLEHASCLVIFILPTRKVTCFYI